MTKLPKLQVDRIDQMPVQELARLKDELASLTGQVKEAMTLRERDCQFAVTNLNAVELLVMSEREVQDLGCHSTAIMRLALLMVHECRNDSEQENPLTQDKPWCSGDYDALRVYADMIVQSNLTADFVKSLVPKAPKKPKTSKPK